MKTLKKIVVIMLLLGSLTAVVGCHTTQGVGEDIESVGDTLQGDN